MHESADSLVRNVLLASLKVLRENTVLIGIGFSAFSLRPVDMVSFYAEMLDIRVARVTEDVHLVSDRVQRHHGAWKERQHNNVTKAVEKT